MSDPWGELEAAASRAEAKFEELQTLVAGGIFDAVMVRDAQEEASDDEGSMAFLVKVAEAELLLQVTAEARGRSRSPGRPSEPAPPAATPPKAPSPTSPVAPEGAPSPTGAPRSPTSPARGSRTSEAWRPRDGHPDGGRYGNRGGKHKEWYTARARASQRGRQYLQRWLKENPRPSK